MIFGTSQGEITTYSNGRHFCLNENAHTASINCIRVTDQVMGSYQLNIVTGGEDGLIKIWDTSTQLL
jgi:WD40 repeat protein